jgi:hypothetical protein
MMDEKKETHSKSVPSNWKSLGDNYLEVSFDSHSIPSPQFHCLRIECMASVIELSLTLEMK